ncbi:hypothetical protein TruAng_006430 [Truncatella angustata]|nr:hypothetical protein TruAng_006430 [Truncatella angustata]
MSTRTWASVAQTSSQPAAARASTPAARTSTHQTTTTSTTVSKQHHHNPAGPTVHFTSSAAPAANHQRNEHYRPRGPSDHGQDVYVLTLLLTPAHQREMSALRRKWFPERLLKVDAHITLFHALPGSRLTAIRADLGEMARGVRGFEVRADRGGVFKMGRGVGVEVDRGALDRARGIREGLRAGWQGQDGERHVVGLGSTKSEERRREIGWLSEQDARKCWKGHYTVMNKEDDKDRKEQCYRELTEVWHGSKGSVTGLCLWRYDRGWWRDAEEFRFEDKKE